MTSRLVNLSAAPTHDGELEQLVELIVDRVQAGVDLNLDALVAAHPEHAEELRELLPAMELLVRMGESAGPSPARRRRANSNLPCQQLGDFRLVREIGRGGMGVVYEAEQVSLKRRVALKVLPQGAIRSSEALARFRIEAQASGLLRHPNIVPVYAVGCDDDLHYYAMQYIDGSTLEQFLEQQRSLPRAAGSPAIRPADPLCETRTACTETTAPCYGTTNYFRTVANLGIQVAEALHHAHCHGVVHRDVKPSNLLIDAAATVYVADFGLAHVAGGEGLTRTGELLGTLRYVSPEQAVGRRESADCRSDVYSLGATLYELATLQPVWGHVEATSLLHAILEEEPAPPRRVRPETPRDLEIILLKALAKDPSERYGSAQLMADDLRAFLEHRPIKAKPSTTLSRLGKWSRRRPAVAIGAAIVLMVLTAAFAASTVLVNRARLKAELALGEKSSLLYVADIQRAYQAWEKGWIGDVRASLDRQRPAAGEPDRRSWEWHLLNSLVQPPECRSLTDHRGPVNELAIFPDGRRLATAGHDGSLGIWNAETGVLERLIKLGDEPLYSVAVSPDGRYVAAGSLAICLCDLRQNYAVRRLYLGESNAESLVFSPCGEYLLASFRYAELCRLDLSGRVVNRMTCTARGESLEFLPHSSHVVLPQRGARASGQAGSYEHVQIATQDLTQIEQSIDYHGREASGIVMARCSPCGQFIAAGRRNSSCTIVYRPTGKIVAETPPYRADLVDMAYSPAGDALAMGYKDGMLKLFALSANGETIELEQRPRAFQAHEGGIHCVRYIRPGVLASCGKDGFIRVWKLGGWSSASDDAAGGGMGPQRLAWDVRPLSEQCKGISVSPDGQELLYLGAREILQYDIGSGRRIAKVAARSGPRNGVDWSRAGGKYVYGVAGRVTVEIGAAEMHAPLSIPHGDQPDAAAFSPTEDLLAIISDQRFQLCRATTGVETYGCALAAPGKAVAFSPNGKQLAYGGWSNEVCILDPATHRELHRVEGRLDVSCLVYSHDNSLLIIGHDDGAIEIWDCDVWRPRRVLLGHEREVLDIALSPDGRTLLSASQDNTVRVWSMDQGQCFGTLFGPFSSRGEYRLSASANGGHLAIASRDDTAGPEVLLWQMAVPRQSP